MSFNFQEKSLEKKSLYQLFQISSILLMTVFTIMFSGLILLIFYLLNLGNSDFYLTILPAFENLGFTLLIFAFALFAAGLFIFRTILQEKSSLLLGTIILIIIWLAIVLFGILFTPIYYAIVHFNPLKYIHCYAFIRVSRDYFTLLAIGLTSLLTTLQLKTLDNKRHTTRKLIVTIIFIVAFFLVIILKIILESITSVNPVYEIIIGLFCSLGFIISICGFLAAFFQLKGFKYIFSNEMGPFATS